MPVLAAREVGIARAVARAAHELGRPLVVHTLYPDSEAAAVLRAEGVLVYAEVERAARALHLLALPTHPSVVPELPAPEHVEVDGGYFVARALLARAGIPLAEARPVRSADDVHAAAAELGFPLVLKALAHEHKSDAGGVVLGIDDEYELERAYRALAARLGPECSLERMEAVDGGCELIVGVRRDPRFGPLLLVGLGGLHAELFRDVGVALAPVEPDEAEALLRSLRCRPLLEGARGRRPLDVAAAARAASALSHLVASAPQIRELEANPLLVRPEGVVALDARLVTEPLQVVSAEEP